MRGQASIEYLMVLGMAVALSTPFIIEAQSSLVELRTGSEIIELQNSVDKLESSIETVNAAGNPARRTFFVEIPGIVTNGEIEDNPGSPDSIVYSYESSEGSSQILRSFDIELYGDLPQQGRKQVEVRAVPDGVNITVVE